MRRVALLILAIATAVGCSSGSSSSQRIDGRFTTLDGASTTLAAFAGSPVLVNFFASTCQPCLTEMPALEHVKQEAAGRVVFVGIDVGDTAPETKAFVESVKVTWHIGRDPQGQMAQSIGSIGLPTTVVLDASGRVVYKHLGALDVQELRRELRSRGYM